MTTDLRGVYTAMASPFGADGSRLDLDALRASVDRAIDAGIHGIVPCGSTGEFVTLSNQERRVLVEVVLEQTAGRVPVVPQTGALSTREAVELAQHAQEHGAAALMVVAPFYEPLTVEETFTFYRDVASSVDIPLMAYNLPAATGVDLNPDLMAELVSQVPGIRYVKDTSGDFTTAARLVHNLGDQVSVFVGWDTLFYAALVEGAAGSVIGAANIVPRELVAIYDAVVAGDLAAAKKQWDLVFPLMESLISGAYTPAIKAGLDALGLPGATLRTPGLPVDAVRRDQINQRIQQVISA